MQRPLYPLYYLPDGFWFSEYLQKTAALAWDQTYRKQRNFNRTRILTANGVLNLSLPVLAKSACVCSEVRLDSSIAWAVQHKKAIEYAYKNAAYFDYYFPDIQNIYSKKVTFLNDLNLALLLFLFKALSLPEPKLVYGENIQGFFVMRDTEIPQTYIQNTYFQLFSDKFIPNLSLLDALMNLGPETKHWLLTH